MSKLESKTGPFIGVDVASKHLDIAVHGSNGVKRVDNSAAAVKAWLDQLPLNSVIAVESTARFHELLAHAAHERGMIVYLLNPRDVRHYARSTGMRGKTDWLDAQMLARLIAHEHQELRPWAPQPAQQQALDELLRRRATIVKHQQGVRLSVADSPEIKRLTKALMNEFEQVLAAIDERIRQKVAQLGAGTQDFTHITSVPGIGLLTGAALLGLFRRLATRSSDAVIAFLGMDLRPMDSGQKTGVRRMTKRGPSEHRRLLFNAAMSASRTKVWQAHYARECAKGLSRVAALNALARRLVRVAFGLFKTKTSFNHQRVAIQ